MPYTPAQFENLVQEFHTRETALLNWKAGEYADDIDRLLNFNEVGSFTGHTPEEVTFVYLLKHIHSIKNAINSSSYTWEWETVAGEGLKQRIADARNYLLLLAACIDQQVTHKKGGQHNV